MTTVPGTFGNAQQHWVGDGFPVRSLFSYHGGADQISPFLLLDHAGPHAFAPTTARRGVGIHPHRGFETVTIVYDGQVEHRDSGGNGGIIGPGDVQWMTAGGGILHEEYHAPAFARSGGPFHVAQLWVNLPARHKMALPAYQAITAAVIPTVTLPDGAGQARVIAGTGFGVTGPARTFSPVNVWDLQLKAGAQTALELPPGHTALLVVLAGAVTANGGSAGADTGLLLSRDGSRVDLRAEGETLLLVLTGAPLDEPVAGYGPFVMNSEAQIRQAIADFNSGRFTAPAT